MSSSKQEVVSLLTEHFRYTPLTLIDDIINTVNELIYRAVTAVEEGLTSTPSTSLGFAKARAAASSSSSSNNIAASPDTSLLSQSELDPESGDSLYPEKKVEVEHGVHQLETLLESSVDRNFDKLEIYLLRNVFDVRGAERWVRLGHYQDLDLSPKSAPQESAQDLLRLRRKLNATRQLNHALSVESRRNAALLTSLRSLLSPPQSNTASSVSETQPNLAFLTTSPALSSLSSSAHPAHANKAEAQTAPLTTNTQALMARLPALRTTLAQLREVQARGLTAPARNAAHVEREAYLESGVKAALGDGSTGGGNGAGGRYGGGQVVPGRDEVRDIEGIARNLGR